QEADHLFALGDRQSALEIYTIIANEDEDSPAGQLVEQARTILEREGVAGPKTAQAEYDDWLQEKPDFDRHIFLAHRAILNLTGPGTDAAASAREAIQHYAAAASIQELGRKDARIYAGLRSRYGGST